ncbi:MAG: UDP-N-acetylmuramoyl-L-alanine--D-glutamate ligase [Proteobacteria bacterium]|nr:UDP-N-acetylmuramoyl-L-alanine--D-glutamate ligase [Pseudomonadota bacterium]
MYTLVVGLGKTGLSVVRYLRALGEAVVVVDSRDIPPGLNTLQDSFSEVEYHTGKFEEALFLNAHRIIVSPGVAISEPVLLAARRNNIEIIGDIDLFAHEVNAPVIGITGSNGKSTVTTLLAEMATQAGINTVASGNIGTPVLDSLSEEARLYVLELSSFQLETLHRLPMKAAVVLNISADHLDRYENLAAYAASKQAIYDNAAVQVINKDDALAVRMAGQVPGQVSGHAANDGQSVDRSLPEQRFFTLGQPQEDEFGVCGEAEVKKLCLGRQALMGVDELKIKGRHNIQNALAALALGSAAGLPMDAMIAALKSFKGLEHRTQFVAEIDGVNWINDSKATNVGAAISALTGLPGKHILIAGGEGKGADFSELTDVVKQHCHAVVLMGKDADKIAQVLPEGLPMVKVDDMSSAVAAAKQLADSLASKGDNVLLAPACASFDMFDNFEQRGDVFVKAVEALQS